MAREHLVEQPDSLGGSPQRAEQEREVDTALVDGRIDEQSALVALARCVALARGLQQPAAHVVHHPELAQRRAGLDAR
jgi:hypothetical protein